MGKNLKAKSGVYLTPEFEAAGHRIGDDVLSWLLRFTQMPLPQEEKTRAWDDLLHELMLLVYFWHYGSPRRTGEPRPWKGTPTIKNFRQVETESKEVRWSQIPLPPTKEVKEIQTTLKTWLHELMHTGGVVIKVPNISEISFSIKKNRKGSRKSPKRQRQIYVQGGYKEGFLFTAANFLEDQSYWLRSCPFHNCPAPIFGADDPKQIYCSKNHCDNAKSKKSYEGKKRKRIGGLSYVIEGGDHDSQLKEVHAHLPFGEVVPSKQRAKSRKKAPSKKTRSK